MAKKNKKKKVSVNIPIYNQSNKRQQVEALKEKYKQQRIPEVPKKSRFTQEDLEYGISQLEPLFTEANYRIEYIKSQGYTSYAIDRVEKEGGKDYFDLEDVTDRESLIEQLYRVRVFLNDKGSTIEGAKLQTAQINAEIYKGKFGNQYNTEEYGHARYDTTIIDKDIASRAFESYRKIESHRANEIVGEGQYGSENLIIALYDAEVRGMDSLVYGEALLDSFQREHEEMWGRATKESDNISSISGLIYDNIKERLGF